MSEWWTYRPSDFLMFSARSYYRLVERYNADVSPLQMLAIALGLGALGLALRPRPQAGHRVVAAVLGGSWLWVAWAFHYRRFATINWAAEQLAWAFALQGLALLWVGVALGRLRFRYDPSRGGMVGVALIVFAVVGFPFVAVLAGQPWTHAEVAGVMPDPTAIATLGFLLLAWPTRSWLMLIPVASCVFSGVTLLTMGAAAGWVPLLAAAPAVAVAWRTLRSGAAYDS